MGSLLFFCGRKNLVYPIAVAIVKWLKVSGNQAMDRVFIPYMLRTGVFYPLKRIEDTFPV